MATITFNPSVLNKQRRIFNTLKCLSTHGKTTVMVTKTTITEPKEEFERYAVIEIRSEYGFLPDFVLEWCSSQEHYRVYSYVGARDRNKERSGYSIMTIGSTVAACEFVVMYGIIRKNRANCKE